MVSLDPHPFELRYGDMVSWVLVNLRTEHNGADLQAAAASALACPILIAKIAGEDGGFLVEVGGEPYGLDAAALAGAYDGAVGQVNAQALGFFSLDAKVTAGGGVEVLDVDGDGIADRLVSREDYGGFIGIVPEALAPRLGVVFEATRVPE